MRGAAKDDTSPELLRDRALPQLELALQASLMAPRLRELLNARGALRLRVLKHVRGKRCVLAYELDDGARAIAKLYRKERARHHAAALGELATALGGSTRVPRPLACWDDLGMVVQEWVPGVALDTYEALGADAGLQERLGRALAELHAAPVPLAPPADLAAHLRRTCHPGLQALAAELPELGPSLRELEGEMLARAAHLEIEPRTCHGDFSPHQIFTHADRVYLVDMDGLCQGDPALDVANLRVGLEAHLGTEGLVAAAHFLDAYRAARPVDRLPGLPHYEALSWLRRAMILWRKRPLFWEEQLHRCIDRSRERLDLHGPGRRASAIRGSNPRRDSAR